MKGGMIYVMVLLTLVLHGPIVNAVETNQSYQPVSGPTDPLPPKPFPPPPSPGPPFPPPPSPGPPGPKQPNQVLPFT